MNGRAWEDKELAFIVKHAKTMPPREMAKHIQRTESMIKSKLYSLGYQWVSTRPGGWG